LSVAGDGSLEEAARITAGASSDAATRFERCITVGGVAVFPSDTVYGLACDPNHALAVERLYLLKRRSRQKPSAVMFFGLESALESLPELGERTVAALARLLPGPLGVLLPNPAGRFPLACGEDPSTLGLRVPAVEALADVGVPALQSSANRARGRDPRTLAEVPELLRVGVDLVIDGGDLPGTPSTVVDLRAYERDGSWSIVRGGALPEQALAEAL
jgi:L-threonylcarbamoyladenylate synthase